MAGGGRPATVVIGLGNPLRGDDGVGVRVAQMLATQSLPDDVEVIDGGTQGLGIVTLRRQIPGRVRSFHIG
jgi:hydrogenase maturation protease